MGILIAAAVVIVVLAVLALKWKLTALALLSFLEEREIEMTERDYNRNIRFVVGKVFGR